MKKLTVMALQVALKILQLKQERECKNGLKAAIVFNEEEVVVAKKLIPKYEGKTVKQKNPYPEESLAWMSWLIGRLGGWKGYRSAGLPGVITLKRGLEKFELIVIGYKFGTYRDVYKE